MKYLIVLFVMLSTNAYATCKTCDPVPGVNVGVIAGAGADASAVNNASVSSTNAAYQTQGQAVNVRNVDNAPGVNISQPRQTATAYANGSSSFSQASCKPVAAAAVQNGFFGVSVALPVIDENCEGTIAAQSFMAMGLQSTACNRLSIATDKNAQALRMSNVDCNTVFVTRPVLAVATPALDAYDRAKKDELFRLKMSK